MFVELAQEKQLKSVFTVTVGKKHKTAANSYPNPAPLSSAFFLLVFLTFSFFPSSHLIKKDIWRSSKKYSQHSELCAT
jgi:hypothetical protein